MLNFLFKRPIAVGMSFLVVLVFSVLAVLKLPVSLLPSIDVPQIIVKVNLPNASPAEIEKSILRPMREALLTASNLQDISSQANSENGQAVLFFAYKTNMELAYIEINEKIDQLINRLPKNMPRPQVIRINMSDVPVVRVQVVPKEKNKMIETSELAEKVIKKRLEALSGVSLVDLNGMQRKAIFIQPDAIKMQALGISERVLIEAISQNNQELGSISVKDGQYRYFMQLKSTLQNADNVRKIAITSPKGTIIPLTELAEIKDTIQRPQGYHFYNNTESLVITLHKQEKAQMPELMRIFNENIEIFKQEYPQVSFYVTQNQSVLLDAGIGNLKNDLLFGGFFAFLMLFIFIGNYKIPFLIGIILPSSLVMSFLVFFVFGVSVNIISLSGLALGLGMTIDNAIIIFDNIGKKRLEREFNNENLFWSCVEGTSEMIAPLVSSALTTQAVFVPLVFLGGISGALAYDQAVAVGAILLTSLLVSFFLLPLLYLLIFKNSYTLPREDNRLYLFFLKTYKKLFYWIFLRKKIFLPTLFLLGFLGMMLGFLLEVEGLPKIERQELLLKIRWNEALNISENSIRTKKISTFFEKEYNQINNFSESEVGIQQFLLQQTPSLLQETELYFFCKNEKQKEAFSKKLDKFIRQNYPNASAQITDAPNAFDLIFRQQKNYLDAKFKNQNASTPIEISKIQAQTAQIAQNFEIKNGEGLAQETQVRLLPNYEAMTRYNVSPQQIIEKVQNLLGNTEITQIKKFGEILPIQLYEGNTSFQEKLQNTFISANNPVFANPADSLAVYPLSEFVKYEFFTDYRSLTADKTGIFHSISLQNKEETNEFITKSTELALKNNLKVDFSGQYFENSKNIQQLLLILLISVALLYFILAIEFENFKMPLIVVFTLPLGFMGSFLLLYFTGQTLNIMAAMGLTVMLGIIDNESILKIDTINRLRKNIPNISVDEAISKAGEITFKPILMTSLTNILALLPFLFDTGLGADLQKPFVIAIIGGLSIGTFTALFFVPLMYKHFFRNLA